MRIARTTEAVPFAPPADPAPPASEPRAAIDAAALARPADSPTVGSGSHPFLNVLRGLGEELDRGENLAERAIRGAGAHAGLSPERLIALQAGIYRYSEAVDLVTKLVDRGTQAVRTTLQNQ